MDIYWLGRSPYRPTWELQERLRQRVHRGGGPTLLLCEHEPVITLGRSARAGDVLCSAAALERLGIERVVTDRGGQVTYHGPGQLVAYPIVPLRRGVLAHVVGLAQAVVEVCAGLGVQARFSREKVGVWVDERKLAAIGVHVQRRVAIHQLPLVPCGDATAQVTSLSEEGPREAHAVADVVEPLARALCRALDQPMGPIVATNVSLLSLNPFVE